MKHPNQGIIQRCVCAGLLAGYCLQLPAPPVLTTNLLLNPGAETGSLTNWFAGGVSNPRVDNGTFDPGISPHSGTNDFLAGTGATGSLGQVVSLVGSQGITAAAIDGGTLVAGVSFWEQGLNQGTPSDDSFVSLTFFSGVSNIIATVTTPEIDSHNLSWSNYTGYFTLPAGTRYVQYTMNFVRHAGSDLDAFVDDNSLTVLDVALLPRLQIAAASANAVVFWPTNFADGFSLQENANLASTNWVASTQTVVLAGGTNQATVVPSSAKFFRLYHP